MGKGEAMSKFYLTDLSSREKPWDKNRSIADCVSLLYGEVELINYAGRIDRCSQILLFGSVLDEHGQKAIKLKSSFFCRVRHCPVCQWRRSLMWKARLGKALPTIQKDYPKVRWLHLTLAVRNCEITSLRDTLKLMNAAWQRITQLKKFPAIGYFKSLEITRGKDGTAHPHFHILLMVESKYFGKNYINQKEWIEMWKKALRVDYDPTAHIQAIKNIDENDNVLNAVKEVVKYTVKGDDLIAEKEWLAELTKQVHKTRAISLGGVLKQYVSDSDGTNEELVLGDGLDNVDEIIEPEYLARWDKPDGRYTITELE
jgi:plasmid rolling circle replication initiator protein Rep